MEGRGDNVVHEMVAMLLAGGEAQADLGILSDGNIISTTSFGGKYRIIDFALSNCNNSGIESVKLLKNYVGTAAAVCNELNYLEEKNPEYVLIVDGAHIYKMNYRLMLKEHIKKGADVTVAGLPLCAREAKRFGIMHTDDNGMIYRFDNKANEHKMALASMGVYIFSWKVLREILVDLKGYPGLEFGRHVLPYCLWRGKRIASYKYNGYWRDINNLKDYWDANMDLVNEVSNLNLYEEFRKVYSNDRRCMPQYISGKGVTKRAVIGSSCEIYGEVTGSVIGSDVVIEEGAVVKDSIIMDGTYIGKNTIINKGIVADGCTIGSECFIGDGDDIGSNAQGGYHSGLVAVGAGSVIPSYVTIGRDTVIMGRTSREDYSNGKLPSGRYMVKDR